MAAVNPTGYEKQPTDVASRTQNTTTYNNGVTVRNRAVAPTTATTTTTAAEPTTPAGVTAVAPAATTGYTIGTAAKSVLDAVGGGSNANTTTGDDINPNPTTTNELIRRLTGGGGGGGGSSASGSNGGSYTAPILPSATDQSAYINAMYAANEQAARENLRAEYENNLAQLDYQQGRLPDTYNAAVDQANAQAAINRANFNEAAAANGLNTGAGSQVRLSQNNALLSNVSAIRKAQADAQAELDLQRTQMEQQYQQAIREAVAKNDLERAQALYQEAKRVDESIVNTAINQANLNWSVWKALYG